MIPTLDAINAAFAEQEWRDAQKAGRIPGQGAGARVVTVPIGPRHEAPEPPRSGVVDVLAEPAPPRVEPLPLPVVTFKDWCRTCGKTFQYASKGMAAIQRKVHEKHAHGEGVAYGGHNPEARRKKISRGMKAAWKRGTGLTDPSRGAKISAALRARRAATTAADDVAAEG